MPDIQDIMQKHLRLLRERRETCLCGREITFAPGRTGHRCACGMLHSIRGSHQQRVEKCHICGDTGVLPYLETLGALPYQKVAACECADLSERSWIDGRGKRRTYKPDIRPYASVQPHGLTERTAWERHDQVLRESYYSWFSRVFFPAQYRKAVAKIVAELEAERRGFTPPDPSVDNDIPF